ncbi:DNA topoisomerase IV [uncultured Croceitalea sp.]|uniref:DNA topoisomerase IV n=1 Tax=uncultured Croceitalea sp. TaxID=1798908 RepID=UPI00330692FD
MNKFSLLFFSILLLSSCQEAPERNCKDFKTGTFMFTTVVDGDSLTTTFVRENTIEIDYFKNQIDTSSIRWINDCEYILKQLNPKNKQEEKSIHIKILTTTDSSYTFEFNTVGDSKKLRGTAYKKH